MYDTKMFKSQFKYNSAYASQIVLYLSIVYYNLIVYNLEYRLAIYNCIFFLKKRLKSKCDN